MNQKKSEIRFVGLHAHTTFSVFDAIGYPSEHYNACYENGGQAMAITDHRQYELGSISDFSSQKNE